MFLFVLNDYVIMAAYGMDLKPIPKTHLIPSPHLSDLS